MSVGKYLNLADPCERFEANESMVTGLLLLSNFNQFVGARHYVPPERVQRNRCPQNSCQLVGRVYTIELAAG